MILLLNVEYGTFEHEIINSLKVRGDKNHVDENVSEHGSSVE